MTTQAPERVKPFVPLTDDEEAKLKGREYLDYLDKLGEYLEQLGYAYLERHIGAGSISKKDQTRLTVISPSPTNPLQYRETFFYQDSEGAWIASGHIDNIHDAAVKVGRWINDGTLVS